jgi:hypothetical protein
MVHISTMVGEDERGGEGGEERRSGEKGGEREAAD